MIVLRVLSYNGTPADGPSAQFDEIGGTIGRADNNQLVLPDPERTISRVHARVVFRNGGYAVVDNGSNPISVNGNAIGAGREQPLKPGDEIQIGGYVLTASAAAAAKSNDPFADLFGDAPMGLAAPPAPPAPRPATGMAPGAAAAPRSPPPPAPRPAAPPPPAALAPGQIPDDWDPFADDEPPPAAAGARASPPAGDPFASMPSADPFAGMQAGGGGSLDDLFGLPKGPPTGGAITDPLADPLGGTPAQAALARPNMAGDADPLQALQRTATLMPPPASASDHGSELNTPMPLPPAAPRPPPPAPATSPLPSGAVFSWNDPPRDGKVVTLPGVHVKDPVPPPPPPPLPRAAPAAQPATAAAPRAAPDELLAALLAGLDAPGLRMEALTPEKMELVGRLLRESTRGAVELLVARAALKREMRAEMTMIVSRENNPLKFSPTVEVALQHLLGPQTPGFMPAAPAMRDAFDDLRAHQLGVMAGMRAALEGVLKRFDPAQLEAKLTTRSAINTLIPATRKARLWESFTELFAQLQSEAQDDFDELFGKAFLKAYEDQLDRLHRENGPR